MHELQPNELLADRYLILGLLGEGGFAVVYSARDQACGDVVAVKVLKATSDDGDMERRFAREIGAFEHLRDPHIVKLIDHGTAVDGSKFAVFELLRSPELGDVLRERGPLDPGDVRRVLRQLLGALSDAHRNGLLHRDVKPENILVVSEPGELLRVKLIDFGIARAMSDGSPSITRTGELIGTPRYMSPEQLTQQPLTAASDLYSLGLVAIEMALGREALHGNSWGAQLDRLKSGHQFTLPQLERLGPDLVRVIAKMSARQAGDRYQSAAAVMTDLAHHERVSVAEADSRPKHTRNIIIGTMGMLSAILGAHLILATPESTRTNRPPRPALTAPPPVADAGIKPRTPDASIQPNVTDKPGRRSLDVGRHRVHLYPSTTPPAPLVIVLHSLSTGAPSVPGLTSPTLQTRDLAQEADLVAWSADGRATVASIWLDGEDRLDTETIPSIVARVSQWVALQPARVYAIGHGPSAREVRRLRCLGDFSAVATTGDGHRLAENFCQVDVPLLRIYGSEDVHAPKEGGPGCGSTGLKKGWIRMFKRREPFVYLSADEVTQGWRNANGCQGPSVAMAKGCRLWSRCRATFATCEVPGGHDWLGTAPHPNDALNEQCQDPTMQRDIREIVWRFFDEHGRDASPTEL